jgi:hypothetical protein
LSILLRLITSLLRSPFSLSSSSRYSAKDANSELWYCWQKNYVSITFGRQIAAPTEDFPVEHHQ